MKYSLFALITLYGGGGNSGLPSKKIKHIKPIATLSPPFFKVIGFVPPGLNGVGEASNQYQCYICLDALTPCT